MSDTICNHICPICRKEYRAEPWKRKCYECYKHYRYAKRIQTIRHKSEIYISHPSVTKEEMREWIKKHNPHHIGWGVEEATQTAPGIFNGKFKIWIDNTNFD